MSTFHFDTSHVDHRPDFAERLAYARALKHFYTGDAPGNAEIGRVAERTGQWVTKWAESEKAPTDYTVHRPVTELLLGGITGRQLDEDERWLFRGEGDPPRPEMWKLWEQRRNAAPMYYGTEVEPATEKKPRVKKSTRGRKAS